MGKVIRVKTKIPLDGRQNYKGVLKSVGGAELVMEIDRKEYVVPMNQVEKANLEYKEGSQAAPPVADKAAWERRS
ncbi:MAG: hypothetical protein HYU99_08845 [Deltaproteobacteria bacterium]|nr:hypothetical protein [Deltaproteobacteria bacterium]